MNTAVPVELNLSFYAPPGHILSAEWSVTGLKE